ncbi:MAG: LacI family DNA-binding transcriptional regulator, partial [Puniceicoccales bacterium]
MPNQRAIAQDLGITQSTVSRALQGSTRIPEATRKLILDKAKELNYRPDPSVAALMERIRSGKRTTTQGTLAVFVQYQSEDEWQMHPIHSEHMKGYRSSSQKRGYNLEYIYLNQGGLAELKR